MELGSENLILHFILLGGGGIKSVKLAAIYIKMGEQKDEGLLPATSLELDLFIRKTHRQDFGCFI